MGTASQDPIFHPASHLPAAAHLPSPAVAHLPPPGRRRPPFPGRAPLPAAHCRWWCASFHRSMAWCSPQWRRGRSGATASPPSRAYRLASSLAPSAPRRTTSSTDRSPPLPRAVHHCHPWPFTPAPDFPSIPQFNGFQKGKNGGWVMNQLPVLLCHEHWTTPTTSTTASRPPSCIAISWWGSAAGALWPFTATTPGRSTPPPQAIHCQQHPGPTPPWEFQLSRYVQRQRAGGKYIDEQRDGGMEQLSSAYKLDIFDESSPN
ncbi:uncharacterized protein [Triticum aestivum]|uniref:uncharacterized protein isoform X1 n=1 Tax=Triticum aestivum TaxID=4565 RepID=UPI001D01221A|nr:uncharacterized protein LOC123185492 isoform X1 [Triticum aestivum]